MTGPVTSDIAVGALPASQTVSITVRLRPSVERAAALDALLAAQMVAGGSSYGKWISPEEFGAEFGATEAEVARVSAWLEASGLAVKGVSASKLRLTATGSSERVAAAFGVGFQRYRSAPVDGRAESIYFANTAAATVPRDVGSLVAGVSGLDDRPLLGSMRIAPLGSDPVVGGSVGVALGAIEEVVEANRATILSVTTSACSSDFFDADYKAFAADLRQAQAQGVTVLASSACGTRGAGSLPASLAEVTAVAAPGAVAGETFSGIVERPEWQVAEGLPADGWREAPDVSADLGALAETLAEISKRAGTRLGNVAPVLYELAKTPGLYAQLDSAGLGVWERATGLGVVDLKRLAEVFPAGTIGTSSLFVPSSYAPTHGQMLTFTATVTSTGGSGVPTGTVTFTSTQKGTLGSATLNASGVATFSTNSLQAGTYTTTSVYSGDANYLGSTSGVATITIQGEVSAISATVAAGAAVGGNATVQVSVTSGSGVGTPSGTVTVAPQGTKNPATASTTLTGSAGTATATVMLPVYEAGQFTLLISCTDPDPSFTCNSPLSIQMTVVKGGTSTTIVGSPMSPTSGQAYTLTATVTATGKSSGASMSAVRATNAGSSFGLKRQRLNTAGPADTAGTSTPTGNMQFMDGTTYLATAAITGGVATYSGTATTAGHNFTAAYQGDQNYATSSSDVPAPTGSGTTPTSTSLTASSYSIAVGQTVTLYSTVYSVGVASTQTGTVTYSAASQGVLGSGTVSGGLATLSLNKLAAGTYVLTATYSGDAVFAPSSSTTTVVLTVSGGAATLSGAIAPASVPYGSLAVLTATASFGAGTVGGPSGTLLATIAGVTGASYTATLVSSATGPGSIATFSFPVPPPGKYTVSLSCPAANTFTCVAPVKLVLTVVRGGTETALTLSPPGPLAGQPTTLTATIGNTGDDPRAYTFTGTVQFFANNALLATAKVNGVTASASVALPAGAEESITAVYSGDVDWSTSISTPVVITVEALPTAITLTSNVTNALTGVSVVLTATVTNIAGGPLATTAPSGLVSFYDTFNGVTSKLGVGTLVSQGANTSIATLNATGLAAGAHSIYAVYAGDLIYLASTSPAISLGFTNFTVTFVPATMTVKQGQSGLATLLVNFQGGFGGSVAFGCTPPPNVEMTCSFSPAVLAVSGTTTLIVGTVAPSSTAAGSQQSDAAPSAGGKLAGGAVLAMLIFFMRPKRRLRGYGALLLLLMAFAAAGATGCTGTNNASSGSGGTTPPVTTPTVPGTSLGTQILTITTAGSDGTNTVRHDFQYQVTVQ